MVLNLVAAASLTSARRKCPHHLLDNRAYILLIEKIIRQDFRGSHILRCPLLARLQNQYQDQFYHFTELPQLICEIDELKQEFVTVSSLAIEQLEILKKFCRDAKNANLNLYHFAD